LVSPGEDFVQRFGPERRALGDLAAHLLDVLLPALLDLVLEELWQCAVTQPLLPLLRMIHDEIRDESPGEPARLLLRILDHEGVHRPQRAGHALARGAGGSRGPTAGSGRRRRGGWCR